MGNSTASEMAEVLRQFKNGRPSESDFANVGRICLQHTGLEYLIESLVWTYMGDVDKGHIATSRMGIQELTDTLLALVEWTEPEDSVAAALEYAVSCFHKLRIKRNSIIHGFNFKADRAKGKLFIERRTKSIVFDTFDQFELTSGTLIKLTKEQAALSHFLWKIDYLLNERGLRSIGAGKAPPLAPTPLPTKPPEPEILIPLPREAPKSARRQRKASEELVLRQAKLDGKERQRKSARNQKNK